MHPSSEPPSRPDHQQPADHTGAEAPSDAQDSELGTPSSSLPSHSSHNEAGSTIEMALDGGALGPSCADGPWASPKISTILSSSSSSTATSPTSSAGAADAPPVLSGGVKEAAPAFSACFGTFGAAAGREPLVEVREGAPDAQPFFGAEQFAATWPNSPQLWHLGPLDWCVTLSSTD